MQRFEIQVSPFRFVEQIIDPQGYRYRNSGPFQRYFTQHGEPKDALLSLYYSLKNEAESVLGSGEILGIYVIGGCAQWMYGKPNAFSDFDLLIVTRTVFPEEYGSEVATLIAGVNPHMPTDVVSRLVREGKSKLKGPDFIDVFVAPGPIYSGRYYDVGSRQWIEIRYDGEHERIRQKVRFQIP